MAPRPHSATLAGSGSRPTVLAAAGLLALALASVADVLLAGGDAVISSRQADTFYYFAHVRAFSVEQILAGNLPLWNPHVFSGQPFLGSIQPALFYPLLAPYLVLPLAWAINLEIVLHVFLMGLFTFAWVRGRGVGPLAAFFAGAAMMCCGAVTLRVLAGQLTVLTAACWTPLAFLAAERLLGRPTVRWTLVGVFALAMQLLAGYPFYAYVTGILLLLMVPATFLRRPESLRAMPALAAMAVAPPLLAAAALLPAVETARESLRAGGVPWWFASSFSLPPANLITALAPAVFGDSRAEYWGAWAFWDMGIHLGVVCVLLAAFGAVRGDREQRRYALPLLVLMLALSLGSNTPVYEFFYHYVPGFGGFRAPSKFALHASLFAALLAATGLDRLLRHESGHRLGAVLGGGLALLLALAGAAAWIGSGGEAWADLASRLSNAHHPPAPEELPALARRAAAALWLAAAMAAATATLFALRGRFRRAAFALALLGLAESFVFAATHHDQFRLEEMARPEVERFYREHPGDYRVLDKVGRNHAMSAGGFSVSGYDPVQLARYGRFSASVQSGGLVRPDYLLPLVPVLIRYRPMLRLVRCRYVFEDWSLEQPPLELEDALPRLLLVGEVWQVPPERALGVVLSRGFDPWRVATVEGDVDPRPTPAGASGRAHVVEESTDHLLVEVALPDAAMLVVTDAYSAGWRARAEGDEAPAQELEVVPVNSFLRGVALPEGRYRVRLDYAPLGYRVGSAVSAAAWLAFLGGALWSYRSSRDRPAPERE